MIEIGAEILEKVSEIPFKCIIRLWESFKLVWCCCFFFASILKRHRLLLLSFRRAIEVKVMSAISLKNEIYADITISGWKKKRKKIIFTPMCVVGRAQFAKLLNWKQKSKKKITTHRHTASSMSSNCTLKATSNSHLWVDLNSQTVVHGGMCGKYRESVCANDKQKNSRKQFLHLNLLSYRKSMKLRQIQLFVMGEKSVYES